MPILLLPPPPIDDFASEISDTHPSNHVLMFFECRYQKHEEYLNMILCHFSRFALEMEISKTHSKRCITLLRSAGARNLNPLPHTQPGIATGKKNFESSRYGHFNSSSFYAAWKVSIEHPCNWKEFREKELHQAIQCRRYDFRHTTL